MHPRSAVVFLIRVLVHLFLLAQVRLIGRVAVISVLLLPLLLSVVILVVLRAMTVPLLLLLVP